MKILIVYLDLNKRFCKFLLTLNGFQFIV